MSYPPDEVYSGILRALGTAAIRIERTEGGLDIVVQPGIHMSGIVPAIRDVFNAYGRKAFVKFWKGRRLLRIEEGRRPAQRTSRNPAKIPYQEVGGLFADPSAQPTPLSVAEDSGAGFFVSEK